MDVFGLRRHLIDDYASYVQSFIRIRDQKIRDHVRAEMDAGALWPEPLIQLNPSFAPGETIDELVGAGVLHHECSNIFQRKSEDDPPRPLRPHRHQVDAIHAARAGRNYLLTTGTGSGKSLGYIIPIVDHVLRRGSGRGIQAIVVYPMNALANSQMGELEKFLKLGFPEGKSPITFARYTGQENEDERQEILDNPPDILLTNYVMLELILTRPRDRRIVDAARELQFLVLDELHTYRGRQGADVAMLVRRARNLMAADTLQYVGTSATLASTGSLDEQRGAIAEVAAQIFGAPVEPSDVITETLRRSTVDYSPDDGAFVAALSDAVRLAGSISASDYESFITNPLARFIESTFGVATDLVSGELVRRSPRSVRGTQSAAASLSELTGIGETECATAIEAALLAGYEIEQPQTDFPVFAFKLHQFISRGDTAYASIETPYRRFVTLYGQQFVPGDRSRLLLPLAFCRECGQEYYSVYREKGDDGRDIFTPREYLERSEDGDHMAGYLYSSDDRPWPDTATAIDDNRVPESWIEEARGVRRIKYSYRRYMPDPVTLLPDGSVSSTGEGLDVRFVPAPFRFCLNCGVDYPGRGTDFSRLTSLGSAGRSTATTILTLSAIRHLRETPEEELPKEARKVLSFTDNRQDASLQAGHFNDFVEVGLLRGALYRAVASAGAEGLSHDELTQRVQEALDLPLGEYAIDDTVKYNALTQTNRALRDVLGYRIYRDLRRGWRITQPNLEQCGLLQVAYDSLDLVSADEEVWQGKHEALVTASAETRAAISRALLDVMRRELAIRADYLEPLRQEQIKSNSNQYLRSPWPIDEQEEMESGKILYPRPQRQNEPRTNAYVSARSRYGQYLRRSSTFSEYGARLTLEDTAEIILQLLDGLRIAGLVQQVDDPRSDGDVPGYQIPAAAMRWIAGDGKTPLYDPTRVNPGTERATQSNQFFVDFYHHEAVGNIGIEAREHTAQVQSEQREERERQFRTAALPVLFCSPTMELGVDISELNVVNMRNVPPTPANYAQRSGRAGRHGQPALVFTYCASGSPHDQYFFRRPELVVAGAVSPPRLDLANEDLIRSHIHAIWLAETGQNLHRSLGDILDLSGERPTMALQSDVRAGLEQHIARQRAVARSRRVLSGIEETLQSAPWYSDEWLEGTLGGVMHEFDRATSRWRDLYRSALEQAQAQTRIIHDATRPHSEKKDAQRLRRQAEAQLSLLTASDRLSQSDFYSYRYYASEGFLPGYSFPRLPLAAFIPGRSLSRDEFLQRPRFLAISEFGPGSIIYHEGARYVIDRVHIPAGESGEPGASHPELPTTSMKQCDTCGYMHPLTGAVGPDVCERCGAEMRGMLGSLFRMQSVTTRRRDRISSDEEERLKRGYELRSGVRFAVRDGRPSFRSATVQIDGAPAMKLSYGDATTIWRLNMGWRRRKVQDQYGFVLDVQTGRWQKADSEVFDDDDVPQPGAAHTARVIPYVEDRRNVLLIDPEDKLTVEQFTSLQAALKNAIQLVYDLEDNELAAELLPDRERPKSMLLYESAEGGAGVLRRLVDDPDGIAQVARRALEVCHFDADGADLRRSDRMKEDCEAACYFCLMSYTNQRDHQLLDRHLIRDLLLDLTRSIVEASPGYRSPEEHFDWLMGRCDSELERDFLRYLREHGHRLPDSAQDLIADHGTRPDFMYTGHGKAAIYIDGPYHDYPERQARDEAITWQLEDDGYVVIRFGHNDDWAETIARRLDLFGEGR